MAIIRCSTSLGIGEMQSKTSVSYYFTPTRMIIKSKRQTIIDVGEDVEKLELLYTVGKNVKWKFYIPFSTLENNLAVP